MLYLSQPEGSSLEVERVLVDLRSSQELLPESFVHPGHFHGTAAVLE